MAWDSSRPVPWKRLTREWAVYAVIMSVVFLLFFRDDNVIGALAGVAVSAPLYLGLAGVLAKFGYKRKTLKELRTPQAEGSSKDEQSSESSDEGRRKPAPTSRTAAGPNRPASKKRRR